MFLLALVQAFNSAWLAGIDEVGVIDRPYGAAVIFGFQRPDPLAVLRHLVTVFVHFWYLSSGRADDVMAIFLHLLD